MRVAKYMLTTPMVGYDIDLEIENDKLKFVIADSKLKLRRPGVWQKRASEHRGRRETWSAHCSCHSYEKEGWAADRRTLVYYCNYNYFIDKSQPPPLPTHLIL